MYCHHCGAKTAGDSARFCSSCGTDLTSIQAPELQADNSPASHSEENNQEKAEGHFTIPEEQSLVSTRHKIKSKWFWPIALPVLSLIIAGGASAGYYYHQVDLNKDVISLKEKAEKEALKGNYKEALSSLEKASKLRPSYKILDEDKVKIEKAQELEKILADISESLKTQNLDEANSQITKFKSLLEKQQGPLFTPFQARVEEKSTILAVAKIKVEINNLSTVQQLSEKLSSLSSLKTNETEEVKRLILTKIVDLATKAAEEQLKEKQFTNAISTIDKGLQYAVNDKKLLSFKDRIESEQTAFEKAEQQRIEQAMEEAAQEDLMNRTAAVNVVNVTASTDDYGDLYIAGEVTNNATVPISSIKLFYTVYDLNGNVIGTDYLYVDTYYLEPGQTSTFESYHFGVYQDTTVEITGATWQLN
nr:FxLYD domain-containing protein [Neobacillus sp. Marseille-Q6967]